MGGHCPVLQDPTTCVSTCVLSLKLVYTHSVNGISLDVVPLCSAQPEHLDMTAMQNRLVPFIHMGAELRWAGRFSLLI